MILYTYCIYPCAVFGLSRLRPLRIERAKYRSTVSVILAVYNEASRLQSRIDNIVAQEYPQELVEIIVVSDGSSDNTPTILQELEEQYPHLTAIACPFNRGKAQALNDAVDRATGDIVVFADARQSFAPDAITRLLENFADSSVGCVSGELILTSPGTSSAKNISLYWRYEKWIRQSEALLGSMLGATGAIYAIRRSLWEPLPPGTILDDLLTPMRIVMKGCRAVFDGRAVAYDIPSKSVEQEYRRKRRTLAGNWQAFTVAPSLLIPWRNATTWWQLWSHKVFRLLVPYAMLVALVSNLMLPGILFHGLLICQLVFYVSAAMAWLFERVGIQLRFRALNLAYTFVSMNCAALDGTWWWLRGRHRELWQR